MPGNLEVLHLDTVIEELPSSIWSLEKLEELGISNCKELKYLPSSSCRLNSLLYLYVEGCVSLKLLPIELPAGLKILHLDDCESLESLPIELPAGLEALYLENCESLESLPIELPAGLKSLVLTGCTSLETVSSSMLIAPRWDEYVNSFKEDYPFVEERIDFGNCLKLDQTARSNIMADAQLRILRRFATASCPLNHPLSIEVLCPGNEIPKWLGYKSEGCSINIKLPPHWSRQGFLGYALCIVLEVNNVTLPDVLSRRSCYDDLCCQTHHKINNSQLDFLETVTVHRSYKNYELLNSDHVFTWYFYPQYLKSKSVARIG